MHLNAALGRSSRILLGFILLSCSFPQFTFAQAVGQAPLTLNDAVQLALEKAPALKESRARAAAADAGVSVAEKSYLPRLDAIWQENRATSNNVFGLVLPQSVVSSISGPVLATHSYDGVWGSAGGLLLTWEAFDFGLRGSEVDAARAQLAAASARRDVSQLDVAVAASDAFLAVLAADEAVRAVRANVDRLEVFAQAVGTLVRNQLRPGADEARVTAELVTARNQLSQAVQVAESARASLAEILGMAGASMSLSPGRLTNLPETTTIETPDLKAHPGLRADLAAIDAARARERVLDHTYVPRVTFQATTFARGSGAQTPGLPPPDSGLWPNVSNWAAGVSVTFPILETFTVQARKGVERENEAAETARYDQTLQHLTAQQVKARALMTAALEIARNTPVGRQAAADAERLVRARYESGLASVVEVADAQRLLAQAEADDAVARLGVWRALLAEAQVHGDLTPFLNQVK